MTDWVSSMSSRSGKQSSSWKTCWVRRNYHEVGLVDLLEVVLFHVGGPLQPHGLDLELDQVVAGLELVFERELHGVPLVQLLLDELRQLRQGQRGFVRDLDLQAHELLVELVSDDSEHSVHC